MNVLSIDFYAMVDSVGIHQAATDVNAPKGWPMTLPVLHAKVSWNSAK